MKGGEFVFSEPSMEINFIWRHMIKKLSTRKNKQKKKKKRCNPPFTETFSEAETYCGSARKLEEKLMSVV
jgi:hypothetical protein